MVLDIRQDDLVIVRFTRSGESMQKVARVGYKSSAWIGVESAAETQEGLSPDEMGYFDPQTGIRVNGLMKLGVKDRIDPLNDSQRLLSDDELLEDDMSVEANWKRRLYASVFALPDEQRVAVLEANVPDETLQTILKLRLAAGVRSRKSAPFIITKLKLDPEEFPDLELKAYDTLRQSLKQKAGDLSWLPRPVAPPDRQIRIETSRTLDISLPGAGFTEGVSGRLAKAGITRLSQLDGMYLSDLKKIDGISDYYTQTILTQIEKYTGKQPKVEHYTVSILPQFRALPISDLSVDPRTQEVLRREEFATIGDLHGKTDEALRGHGFGRRTLQAVYDAIQPYSVQSIAPDAQ